MNEELRQRAVMRVARETWARTHATGWPPFDQLIYDDPARLSLLEHARMVVDIALAVVADWCDEQRLPDPVTAVGAPEHYNTVMTSGIWLGWRLAHEGMARACRP